MAARLPFLLSGTLPFDSDEAVQGLMARHVLEGEWPAFFWGQAYKGVPEVYGAALAFALFGSSVTALKSVTLALFAALVALNFVLLDRVASRWIAVAASLLLVAAPPPLVRWSLTANAEYVIVMLLGTGLLLLVHRAQRGRQGMLMGGILVGVGLWVQQLFIVYLLPLAWVLASRARWISRLGERPSGIVVALYAIGAVYAVLAAIAFVTGGFSLSGAGWDVSVRAPQKMARIALAIGGLAVFFHTFGRADRARDLARHSWPLAVGFATGYAPAILYSVLVEPARAPVRSANLFQLIDAAPDLFGNIWPIVFGFKSPTTERLPLAAVAALPGATALAVYVWKARARLGRVLAFRAPDANIRDDFFPLFVLLVPALLLFGGVYIDTQSYRYLLPWYAGLSVAWASGSLALSQHPRAPRLVGAMMLALILAIHVWQQVLWSRTLVEDTESRETLACLERRGIRGGIADYWTAYKVTFLSRERIIIAPATGVDRYPAYSEYVASLPARQRIDLTRVALDCEH